jgi:hypothetical protein
MSFLGREEEQLVELTECGSIRDKAAIDYKLHVLAESHCVGFGFGEAPPQLSEAGFVGLTQHNGVVLGLRHLNIATARN